ncbi:MAG: hypothetical protein IKJ75_00985 [Clostridia bacterium]|nr:hypothetical protein [Clostridia bacterium]
MKSKRANTIIKYLLKILPHVSIITSLAYVVLFIIDRVNPAMNFIGFAMTKVVILVLAICSTVTSALIIYLLEFKNRK